MQTQIELCEQQIEKILQSMVGPEHKNAEEPAAKKKKGKNQPRFKTADYLKNIYSVEVTQIYGVSEIVALEILSETGTNLSK